MSLRSGGHNVGKAPGPYRPPPSSRHGVGSLRVPIKLAALGFRCESDHGNGIGVSANQMGEGWIPIINRKALDPRGPRK